MPDEIAEFHNEVVLLHQSASINSLAHILLVQSPHKLPLILKFRELTLITLSKEERQVSICLQIQ